MTSPASPTSSSRGVGRPPGATSRGVASRDRIIEAAAGVFAAVGYDRATMAQIVEASGLTKGSVYFHFASKEALAVEVLTRKQAAWLERVRTRLAAAAPGLERLEALLPAMLELHREDPDAWAISRLSQHLAEVPETRATAAELNRAWVDEVAALIAQTQASGRASSQVEARTLALVMVSAFDGLKKTVQLLEDSSQRSEDELAAGGAVLLEMMRAVLRTDGF
ncbi:TetR family transcriptional regulator [Arthrobacter sp. RAF14]|uniref:TetR family transcriptional regulator n=1 Tax=Arthrobacter sp. RAF14 TaxID=3233051 RepID=UPI003F911852